MTERLTKTRFFLLCITGLVLSYFFFSREPIQKTPTSHVNHQHEVKAKSENYKKTGIVSNEVKTPQTAMIPSQEKQIEQSNVKKDITVSESLSAVSISAISDELTDKQKENLANEIEITRKGWLIHPYDKTDANGSLNPILKYVPHLDNQGNFHSVSIFDVNQNVGEQLAYAYPIPYTSEFPPVTVEEAKEIFLKEWNNDRYVITDTNKLVWLAGDRYTPYRLYTCKTKQKEKVYIRDGREIRVLLPREVTTSHCLINVYSGHIRWGNQLNS